MKTRPNSEIQASLSADKLNQAPELSADLSPKITVQGKQVCFNNKKQTLLECLEENAVEVHYHCRDGFCGACRVKLTAGEISYPQGEPLAFIGENEILPCCCVPVTNISLEIDE